MSFVTLGGDGSRPTYFELIAAERLVPSLRAAVVYSLSVYSQRRPGLARLLAHEEELLFLLAVVLDRASLRAGGASFAEGLYALKRVAVARDGAGSSSSSELAPPPPLSRAQRQTSLVLLVRACARERRA